MLVGLISTLIRFEQTYYEHSQVCTHVSAFCANTQTQIQTVTHTPGRRGKIHSALQSTPLRPLNPKNSPLLDGCLPLLISLPDIESTSFASGYIKPWLMFFVYLWVHGKSLPPKSTPIVEMYLDTNFSSQYLLIKHDFPVPASPMLITCSHTDTHWDASSKQLL